MNTSVKFASFWSHMPETIRVAFSNIDSSYWQDESIFNDLSNAEKEGRITSEEYKYAIICIALMTLIADTYLHLKDNHSGLWLLSENAQITANNIVEVIPAISSIDLLTVAKFLWSEVEIWFTTLYAFLSDKSLWSSMMESDQLFHKFTDYETQLRYILDKAK